MFLSSHRSKAYKKCQLVSCIERLPVDAIFRKALLVEGDSHLQTQKLQFSPHLIISLIRTVPWGSLSIDGLDKTRHQHYLLKTNNTTFSIRSVPSSFRLEHVLKELTKSLSASSFSRSFRNEDIDRQASRGNDLCKYRNGKTKNSTH